MAISNPVIRKVHVTAPIEEICKVLREDGVVVVENYAPQGFVDALNAEAYPVFEKVRQIGNPKHVAQGKKNFRPANTDVILGLAGKVPTASIKLLQHPVWHGVMEHFLVRETWDWLGDEKRVRKGSYWLQACNGYRVRPGATAQYLHRDSALASTQREIGLDKNPIGVGGFVAGTNVTARNGGTNIIPGSHLWPLDRIPRPEEAVAAELKKGDGVFWLSTVFHGA
ncbi:hypothetical protein CLAIMM_06666 [Cladophialophora immunda]|nr:hypothetical protein CLAIMM_06666 [Cladophialophora immunda]